MLASCVTRHIKYKSNEIIHCFFQASLDFLHLFSAEVKHCIVSNSNATACCWAEDLYLDVPSEKYFRAKTNGSSASFFLLSFSATLILLLPLRLDADWSLTDDWSESDRFCVAAISTLPKLKNTVTPFVFSHSNKTQIIRATVCPALAQSGLPVLLLRGSCSPFVFHLAECPSLFCAS